MSAMAPTTPSSTSRSPVSVTPAAALRLAKESRGDAVEVNGSERESLRRVNLQSKQRSHA
jgi:hypothetical protein